MSNNHDSVLTINEDSIMKNNLEIREYRKEESLRASILERRKKQLQMRFQGHSTKDIKERLSSEYNVSAASIEKDWEIRDTWMLDAVSVTDVVETIGTSIGTFTAAQSARQEILGDILRSIAAFREMQEDEDGRMNVEATKQLESLYSMVLRLLNDTEASTEKKIAMLTKMGVLKEAAKRIVIDHKVEDKRLPTINWMKILEGMTPESRRDFFDSLSQQKDIIDVNPHNAEA